MVENKFYKEEWFWVIVGVVILGIIFAIFFNSNTNPESLITKFIENEGYTIILLELSEGGSTLNMDGKGSSDRQAIAGLMGMVRLYPNSKKYTVEILSDTQTCSYTIDSETAERVREDSKILLEEFSLMNKICY